MTDTAPQLPDQATGVDPREALAAAATGADVTSAAPATPQEDVGTAPAAPQEATAAGEEAPQGAEPQGAQEAAALRVGALVAFARPRPGVSPDPVHFGIVVGSGPRVDVVELGPAASFDPATLWPL